MRTRQRRKRKGESDKEDDEERNSDEEVPLSLLQQFGERICHKHWGKHLLSVAHLDSLDVALFVVAASSIKKSTKKWKASQLPPKTEEVLGEAGDESHEQQSPRARRQTAGGRRRKTPRNIHSTSSARTDTATLLADKIVATAFFEPSTRTRCSFETAAMRLGGQLLSCSAMSTASSIKKGETLEDTVRMLASYADAIVLRHPEQGSAARAAAVIDSRTEAAGMCCLINAGDGSGEHPTQALLDVFTIAELFPEWWAEQLQRLTKNRQQEHLPGEKGRIEDSDDVKKENKGAGVMQQEREGEAMDNQHQQQTVSHAAEEGSAGSGDQQSGGLLQKMEEGEAPAGGNAVAAATPGQSSSSIQDVTASVTPAADAEEPPEPRKLTVALVGDLKHARTVHSLALLLSKFNCRIITLSATDLMLPGALEDAMTSNFAAQGGNGRERLVHGSDFIETIRAADVLYMTRMQTERLINPEAGESFPKQFQHSFVLTKTLLETHAKPHVKVLHPLPRVNEIDTTVDTTPFCAYFTQAENGLYMRMALLAIVLNPYTWQLLFGV